MITLHCRPPRAVATEIRIGDGAAAELHGASADRGTLALVDAGVADRHPNLLAPTWTALQVVAGESLKTLAQAEVVLRAMAALGIDRRGLLVAVGGGTVGDLGGLCAALYLRGIECWQVPTTLLAMVDSAVGGKTAVNLPEGKNLVGCVHPPTRVAIDPSLLRELPEVEFQSGLAEVVKVAIGLDGHLFELLERRTAAVLAREPAALELAIHRAVAAKAEVVASDLREDGPRRLLNLGHTLGHALEAHAGYTRPHGLCVARGLWFALAVAVAEGAITGHDADRCRALLTALGFAPDPLPPVAELLPFLRRDKKAEGASVHFVLPIGIGRSAARPLPMARLEDALDS
ncbi:MAG: 3-dehydroquinate synthase family protein [Planctomycetota bacterium]